MKYRKKPVIVEATQRDGDATTIPISRMWVK